MKTIRKSMLLIMGIVASTLAMSQINLGVQTTTQAVLNSAISTASVTRVAMATTQATKSAANVAAKSTMSAKNSGAQTVSQTTNSTNADVNARGTSVVSFSQSSGNLDVSSNTSLSANSKPALNNAYNVAGSTAHSGEKTASTAIQGAKNVELKTLNGARSATQTNATVNTSVKSESSAEITKQ